MTDSEVKKVEIILPLPIKDVVGMKFGLIHIGFGIRSSIGGTLILLYENKRVGTFNPYSKNVEYKNRCAEQEGKPKKGSVELNDKYSYLEEKIKQAFAIGAITKQANKMCWKAEIQKKQSHFLGVLMNRHYWK